MTFRTRTLAALMLLVVGMTPSTSEADTLEPMDLYLVMYMSGVTAGSLKLSIDPKDDRIDSRLKMKSQGLFKFLTGYKSSAESKSTLGMNGEGPGPVSYESTYETKKNERKVQIHYDVGDGRITDLKAWKRGEPRKTKVPENLRKETVDPLTAVLQLRHWIKDIRAERAGTADKIASTTQSFEVFDGRSRYRLNAELLGRRKISFDGKKRSVFRFKVQMSPLAGFSSKDMLANWASEDGKRWIELIVTDDDNPLPVYIKTQGGTLQTTIYLRKVCLAEAGCNKIDS